MERVLGKPPEARQRHSPLSKLSPRTEPQTVKQVALPWQLPKAPPFTIYGQLFYTGQATKGVKAALPNTQKQTQGGCQMRIQGNMAQKKE